MNEAVQNWGKESSDAKGAAFNEGNQDNTSKLSESQSENEDPGGKKITNQDDSITNQESQNETAEDAEKNLDSQQFTVSKEKGPARDDGSPEINTPVYEPEETEKKVPKMNKK